MFTRPLTLAPLLLATTAHATLTYTAIDLNPTPSAGSHASAAAGTFQAGDAAPNTPERAALWNATPTSYTSLHPAAVSADASASSYVLGMTATRQVGYVAAPFYYGNANYHAYAWSNSASSAVDLHPAAYTSSLATATDGTQTVGQIKGSPTFNQFHASLWTGNSTAIVDLNPTTQINSSTSAAATSSFAYGVAAGTQVGTATVYLPNTFSNPQPHAFAWAGSAPSAVDLNPAGFSQSAAFATTGSQHAGKGLTTAGPTHALLWTSTNPSAAVDLNPTNFLSSEAHGIAPGLQVGFGYSTPANNTHALVWFNTPDSVIDLNAFLPAGYTSSQAYAVTPEGYITGSATNGTTTHAFLWIPNTPEPTTLALLSLTPLLLRRRR